MAETLGTDAGSGDPEKERAEVLTARDIIASAAIEIAEDALPDDFRREFQSIDESSVVDRLATLLTNPSELFAKLNVSSGWLAPLVLVTLAALLNAAVVMGTADLEGWFDLQRRKAKQAMPEWQQRRMAADGPAALRTQDRMQSFALKAGLFVMPVAKTLFELVFFSAVLFVIAVMSEGQRSLRLCAVVVAHAQLIDVVKSFAMAIVSAGTGLPIVQTSPAGLIASSGDAVLRGVLSWCDPFSLSFFVFLALGLEGCLQCKRPRRAMFGLWVLFVVGVAASVGLALLSSSMTGMRGAS